MTDKQFLQFIKKAKRIDLEAYFSSRNKTGDYSSIKKACNPSVNNIFHSFNLGYILGIVSAVRDVKVDELIEEIIEWHKEQTNENL